MASVHLETTSEQLLKAVSQLPPAELDRFVREVIVLRLAQKFGHLSSDETALLKQIYQTLLPQQQERYQWLVLRRDLEQLTPEEYAELLELGEQAEQIQARRLEALTCLAQLRGKTIPELMEQLGLHFE